MFPIDLSFILQIGTRRRPDERTRTTDFMRCRGLQRLANPAYLSRNPFPALLRVAPYCAPGGVRVVSIASSYSPNAIVPRRPVRFNLRA